MTDTGFHNVPCIYFSLSEDGTILDVNEKLAFSLNLNKDHLIGKKADVMFTVATRIFQQTHFYPLLKMHGYAEEIYITLKKSNGAELPLIINAERRADGNDAIYHYAGIVVHNRKKFEEEIIAAKKAAETALRENTDLLRVKSELQHRTEELDEKLHQIEKHNEELRQFNRVITHDMQEPIRKLSILSNMMGEEPEDAQRLKLSSRIQKVTGQMRNVISGLQQYVWLNEKDLKITEVDLDKTIDYTLQLLVKEFPSVKIEVNRSGLVKINADAGQMQVLFYQTLKNAIQFRQYENAVDIHIETKLIQLNKFKSIEGKYKFVHYVRIQIRDNGKGFSSGFKDQAFELFKRLHEESGSGVGLALCRKIVNKHNGNIDIESEAGKGTVLTIHLPFYPEDIRESQEQLITRTNPLIDVQQR